MRFALPGALALACAFALSGCGAAVQATIQAAAPALETQACDALFQTAPAQTLCIDATGALTTVGEALAKAAPPASTASTATALALPPAAAPSARHSR